jgi:hypothetical protein
MEGGTLLFGDDCIIDLKCALIGGDDKDEVSGILDEVLAVRLAAAGAPGTYDSRFFEIFRAALTAEHANVRLAALEAVAYPGWPQLVELVAARISDPDEDVRRDAEIMLKAMRASEN